jgi:hypothetical protein
MDLDNLSEPGDPFGDGPGIYAVAIGILRSTKKPGTGNLLHTQEPVTVASFRTWRGWREYVA